MKTLQKQIKFSKGMIHENLLERSDLQAYDDSAASITNCVSTVYGGIKTRQGTQHISYLLTDEEITVTPSSDIGGNTEHIQDFTSFQSDVLQDNKLVALFDLKDEFKNQQLILEVKDVALTQTTLVESSGPFYQTLNLPKGEYQVTAVSCGGGGLYLYDDKAYVASGGGGSYFKGKFLLEKNDYLIELPEQQHNLRTQRWYDNPLMAPCAGDFTFGNILRLSAGKGAQASYTTSGFINSKKEISITPGAGGNIFYDKTSLVELISSSEGMAGEKTVKGQHTKIAYGGKGFLHDYGTGGSVSDYYNDSYDQRPQSGYFKLEYISKINLICAVSQDGKVFEKVGALTIGAQNVSSKFIINPQQFKNVRFVKIFIDDEHQLIPVKLKFEYLKLFKFNDLMDNPEVKLEKFIFNNTQKYLCVLLPEKICIFENDLLVDIIDAPGLKGKFFKTLKTSQYEDTLILTHPDMKTKQLQRTLDAWVWKDFEFENIPFDLFEVPVKTPKSSLLTPSDTEGQITIVSSEHEFNDSCIGQIIDGGGGRAEITQVMDSNKVMALTIIPFYTADAFSNWTLITGYEPVWSESRGWPSTCLFAQQRLWFGGSKSKPSSIWASRVNLYNDFKNTALYDNDAIHAQMITNDEIFHLVENRGIHIFTAGSEWTVSENNLTPKKFSIVRNSQNGSLREINPVLTNAGILFIERNAKSILSYSYDYNQAGYIAQNISLLAHLMDKPVALEVEINSSLDKGDFIYLVLEDGSMLITCFLPQQNINSTALFETNGDILDVICLLDQTYIVVKREEVCTLEKLNQTRTDATQKRYIYQNNLEGLDDFKNQSVAVYTNDNQLIYMGKINTNSLALNSTYQGLVFIGIPFDFEIVSNPIVVSGQSFSLKKRITSALFCTKDTYEMTVCGQTKRQLNDVFKFYALTPYSQKTDFKITGCFYPVHIMSVLLEINYGQ